MKVVIKMMVIFMLDFLLFSFDSHSLVWRTTGTTWFVKGDMRVRSKIHRKVPRVYSKLSWVEIGNGAHPPRGMDYSEWIGCQPYFANVSL